MAYFKVPNCIFAYNLCPGELSVLSYLYSVPSSGVRAYYVIASLEKIAAGSGYRSADSAAKALCSLAARGLVAPFNRFRPDGTRASNGYTLTLPNTKRGFFMVERRQFQAAATLTGKTGAALYLFLARCKNLASGAFPSLRQIAAAIRATVPTVLQKITGLCESCILHRQRRKKRDRSFGHNLYILFSFARTPQKRAEEKHVLGKRASQKHMLATAFQSFFYCRALRAFCQEVKLKFFRFWGLGGTKIFRKQL